MHSPSQPHTPGTPVKPHKEDTDDSVTVPDPIVASSSSDPPSGEKHTALTDSLWPTSACSSCLLDALHSRIVSSCDAEAMRLPSGEKHTA